MGEWSTFIYVLADCIQTG